MEKEEYEEKRHWHLDKRLNLGHIGMTLTLASGIFWWASGVEQRVGSNASKIMHVREIMAIQSQHVTDEIKLLHKVMNGMDGKIDKLIERGINGPK
jgi:hypothetical protein